MFMVNACSHEIGDNGVSPSPTASLNESYWFEFNGRFSTYNLAKAQKEIPFPIIIPTYLPDERPQKPFPLIDGPLSNSRDDNKINVYIEYSLSLGGNTIGYLNIEENNYPIIPEDPELNPDYEYIVILGKKLIKTEANVGLGPGVIYFLNLNDQGVHWYIQAYNFSEDEAYKIVESMIKQLE
jgi:hypothetical protein